jgi:DNA-binding NarL/FixJ family response regulator
MRPGGGPRVNILLVDDHALIRDALRGVIKELVEDASVLEASDARRAMQLIQEHADLHLVLLDLNLPDRDGLGVLVDLRQRYATMSVVVLSACHDRELILKALSLGALGFIPKAAPREVMVNALRPVKPASVGEIGATRLASRGSARSSVLMIHPHFLARIIGNTACVHRKTDFKLVAIV